MKFLLFNSSASKRPRPVSPGSASFLHQGLQKAEPGLVDREGSVGLMFSYGAKMLASRIPNGVAKLTMIHTSNDNIVMVIMIV